MPAVVVVLSYVGLVGLVCGPWWAWEARRARKIRALYIAAEGAKRRQIVRLLEERDAAAREQEMWRRITAARSARGG